MIKQNRMYIIIYYIIAAACLVTAYFVDLKLDIFLNDPKNPFCLFIEGMGEMPARLVCPIAGTLIFYLCDKVPLKILGFLVSVGGSAYAGYHISYYFFPDHPVWWFGWGMGLFIGLIVLYLGQFIAVDENLKKAFIVLSFAGIIIMFVHLGFIEVMKSVWGRVRFRELIALGSYDEFTSWLKINGINGHRSFPSGHTGGASMSYLMMLVPFVSPKWNKRKALCFVIPLLYTGLVAFTRLVVGAHYLSDVTMGGTVGFTVTIVGMIILDKTFFNTCNLESDNV